jgi:hypothetical protein
MPSDKVVPRNQRGQGSIAYALETTALRISSSPRNLTPLRWLNTKAVRWLHRLYSHRVRKASGRTEWHDHLHRSIGHRAVRSLQPGERLPDLSLHDIDGTHQQLSRCWDNRPALLVTMSLSCGQTRKHTHDLERLARHFEQHINTVVIYVVEAHPVDAPSPYTNKLWVPIRNKLAGIHCAQPRTLEQRIELARELRRRFRLSAPMLIDSMDDRAWRAFGSAPNVAILVGRDGIIAAKQGWFEPEQMEQVIVALLRNSSVTAADHTM